MKLLRSRLRRALLAATPLFLLSSGCESSTGSGAEVYTLATVRDQPLPAPYAGGTNPSLYLVTEGTLVLHRDGTGITATQLRCRAALPVGAQCDDPPLAEIPLTWSREEGWVDIGGARSIAVFDGDGGLTIYYPGEHYRYVR